MNENEANENEANENEVEFLDALFTSPSETDDGNNTEFPMVDVPNTLSDKLYAITESAPAFSEDDIKAIPATLITSRRRINTWPVMASIAASLFVSVMGFQFYQQHQTLKQLTQAQADLATALHYLGEANRITQEQVRNTLGDNLNKAAAVPAIEPQQSLRSLNDVEEKPNTDNSTQHLKL